MQEFRAREGETSSGEMKQKQSEGVPVRHEKVAGLCPRDINRRAVKEVAHSFFFSFNDGFGVSTNCSAHTQGLRD